MGYRGCPVKLTDQWRGRLLLACDLHRAAELLRLVPQQAEAARLRCVLARLVNQLWPLTDGPRRGRHSTRPNGGSA